MIRKELDQGSWKMSPEERKEEIMGEMRKKWGYDYPEMDMYIASRPSGMRIEKRWGYKIKEEFVKGENGAGRIIMVILTPLGLNTAEIIDGSPDFESMRLIPDEDYFGYYYSTMNRLSVFEKSQLKNEGRQPSRPSTYKRDMPQGVLY